MRKTNNGAPPSLRQQGRALRTSYGAWALDAAAEEVMDDLWSWVGLARPNNSPPAGDDRQVFSNNSGPRPARQNRPS